jgi:nitroreductase
MDERPAADLLNTMYANRAVRRFRPDPVPEDVLVRLIEAATRAPNGTNAQRWRFVVVRDPGLRQRLGSCTGRASRSSTRPGAWRPRPTRTSAAWPRRRST